MSAFDDAIAAIRAAVYGEEVREAIAQALILSKNDAESVEGKEDSSNKKTTFTGNESSNSYYPSIKAVVDYLTAKAVKYATFSNLDNCLDNCLDNSTIYHGTLGGHTVNVFCVSSSSNRSQYVFRGDNQSATILSRHSHYSSTTSSWGEWSDLAPIGNTNNLVDGAVTNGKLAQEVKDTINAKMDADDATVYHVDTTTQTLTYDNTNPKTIYLNARVSYGSVSNRTAVVISTSSKGYQFAITVTGDILMRSGGGIYPTDWTVLYGSSYKKNSINDDNKNSSVFIPTIGAVVSYLVANYIGNGSGTVTENNLATALKNSLYHVDNTTETVAYSADNPRTIYTNARVNGNKPTLVFTLGDDSQLAMHKDGHLYCRTYANGAYGSWIDLKATSIGESNKTSSAYPTVQAVYNFVTAFVASAISGKANTADVNTSLNTKEDLSNKVPNRTAMDNRNSETQYPSIKTMVQYTDEKALGVQAQVEDVKAYIGYTESDILGLCADLENKRFTRLAGAEGLTAGEDFDGFSMFGGRRRCNVADDGTINAFYGDADYTEDGSNGQVMVYQPKFYYKVVPLKLEKQSSGLGYHIRKANYYVTATPHAGFKLHPLFYDANGNEVEYVLLSAYEGCLYDVSAGDYINDNAPGSYTYAQGDRLCSVAGKKPVSGKLANIGTKANFEEMAQAHGTGWHLDTIKSVSANQLLMLIELGQFNTQTAIGLGVVNNTTNGSYNCASMTGSTAGIGNETGMASATIFENGSGTTTNTVNGKLSVSYRGVENPWGNIYKQINGVNLWGDGTMNGGQPYIAENFSFNEESHGGSYHSAGFTFTNANGYVSAFGYGSEKYDWLFLPTAVNENGADNTVPVGDRVYCRQNISAAYTLRLGGAWETGDNAGEFSWYGYTVSGSSRSDAGGRLLYVPTAVI